MISLLLLALVATAWAVPVKNPDPMINEGLFEGDIKGIDLDWDRNAVPRDSQRWPEGVVPYVIDPSLNSLKSEILRAMKHIEDNTCIRFRERIQERYYLKLFKENGCWSYWGFLNRGVQTLSLGPGCEPFGTIVHELLHAIGFEHEHNRSDRDNYLDILWNNIEQKWYYAFKKLQAHENRLLTDFDYDSIMLYGQYSFSSTGQQTMRAKDGRFMPEVYNKKAMSADDITRIKKLYNC